MAQEDRHRAFTKHVFLGEIENQSRIALGAADRLAAIEHGLDPIDIWSAVQSILIAAGNVSKILWPPRKTAAPRGATLRALLDVDNRNPLSDRNFRNHFEHYDERIEDWFEENRSAVYMDSRIDPFESIWGRNPANLHRGYDPSTQTLTFRGESMSLESILRALDKIRKKSRSITQL